MPMLLCPKGGRNEAPEREGPSWAGRTAWTGCGRRGAFGTAAARLTGLGWGAGASGGMARGVFSPPRRDLKPGTVRGGGDTGSERGAGTTVKCGAPKSLFSSRAILFLRLMISFELSSCDRSTAGVLVGALAFCPFPDSTTSTAETSSASRISNPSSWIARLMDAKRSSMRGSAVT